MAAPSVPESRLTAFPRAAAVDPLKVAPLAFRKLGVQVLVTSDGGGHQFLSPEDFARLLGGGIAKDEPLWKDAQARDLVKDHLDFQAVVRRTLARQPMVWAGPNVHRVAVTERMPPGAPTSAFPPSPFGRGTKGEGHAAGADMTLETARATVEWIFSTPATALTIEIAGGLPLANWPAVRLLCRYARTRAEREGKALTLTLDADPRLLDESRLEALLKDQVALRFVVDGPAELHDALAAAWGGADHAATARWLGAALARTTGEHDGFAPRPVGRVRVARRSLGSERAVVEELLRLGLETVTFEFLDSAPGAEPAASPEEFARFYEAAFAALVRAGLKGKVLRETRALRCATRMLTERHWDFPALEPIDRIGYGTDGSIRLFDGGPGLAPDPVFRVGDVRATSYNAAMAEPVARAGMMASRPEAQPLCGQCAYRPFCGSEPAPALAAQGTLWGRTPDEARCRVAMGVFDVIFARGQEWEVREKLFARWLQTPAAGAPASGSAAKSPELGRAEAGTPAASPSPLVPLPKGEGGKADGDGAPAA